MLCFAGLELPPELHAALVRLTRTVAASTDGFKPMPPNLLHCTAVFFGKVDYRRRQQIQAALAALADAPRGTVTITRLDQFPETKRNLVVARLALPPAFLAAQQRAVRATDGDPAPWTPHVTLGKLRHPAAYTPVGIAPVAFPDVEFKLGVRGGG